jgi:hypothetical protein
MKSADFLRKVFDLNLKKHTSAVTDSSANGTHLADHLPKLAPLRWICNAALLERSFVSAIASI